MQRHAQIPRHPPRITHTQAHGARQCICERQALAAHQWQPTECLEARFLPFASLAQKQHHQPWLATHHPYHLSTCRACPTFVILWMPAERGSAGQRPSRGVRKELFGEIVPISFKDLRFVRLEGFPHGNPSGTPALHGNGDSLGHSALACCPTPRAEGFAGCAPCWGPGFEDSDLHRVRRLRGAHAPVPTKYGPNPTHRQSCVKLVRRFRPPPPRAAPRSSEPLPHGSGSVFS